MMTCIAAAMMFAASVCGACDANLADFPRLAGCEKLYEGDGRRVEWIGSRASGGAGMAADAARLFPQNPPCRPRQ